MGGCGSTAVSSAGPEDPSILHLDHFTRGRQVGEGGFGKVFAMRHYETQDWFAMKDLSKKTVRSSKSTAMIFNERNLLAEVPKSKWMINMHYAFQDDESCYIIMDLALGGDLRYHMRTNNKSGKFGEPRARFYALCVVLACEFLHSHGIVHRDVKPENVVVDTNGYCRLTDLGISRKVGPDGLVAGKSGTRRVG